MTRDATRVTRRRAAATDEARAARLTRDATRVTRRRAAETDEARGARLADNTGREARRRAEEIPHQREDRQVRDALRHQDLHRARLEQAHRENRNLARYDDTDYFREELHVEYRHALSRTSISMHEMLSL